jgi:predicted TIM-barrel fold metal-dependent hydrolase
MTARSPRLDGHVHIDSMKAPVPDALLRSLRAADLDGCLLISAPHAAHLPEGNPWESFSWQSRLENLLDWTRGHATLHPVFWIDPIAEDALLQVEQATKAKVEGFKIICSRHEPSDTRALPVYQAIARQGRPILFHSGISWDGNISSRYNQPIAFEPLLLIDGLRFSLAHGSWPWIDECIALYGKFLNAKAARPSIDVEMFIDTTPGTPPIYRSDLIRKLYGVGYDIEDNLVFGSDSLASAYNVQWTREWMERDAKIVEETVDDASRICDRMFGANVLRFLGIDRTPRVKKVPVPGEK